MVASIGKISSPSQGANYHEKDDPAHRDASAWAGKGADALGLSGPVDPDAFRVVLEGRVPDGRQLGRRDRDGHIRHRPGLDVTLSAPKSVSLMAMVGGDDRVVGAHDRAVGKTLDRIEKNAVETRTRDPATGASVPSWAGCSSFGSGTSRSTAPPTKCMRQVRASAAAGPPPSCRRAALRPTVAASRSAPGHSQICIIEL